MVERATPGDLYPLALSVLAAEKAGVMKEPALKGRIDELVAQVHASRKPLQSALTALVLAGVPRDEIVSLVRRELRALTKSSR